LANPAIEFSNAFTTGIFQLRASLTPQFSNLGIKPTNLIECQPLKLAKIHLTQLSAGYDIQAVAGGNNLSGC
jgi:hypothetical protein